MNKLLALALVLATLVALAATAGARPIVPECTDLLQNMLVCGLVPP